MTALIPGQAKQARPTGRARISRSRLARAQRSALTPSPSPDSLRARERGATSTGAGRWRRWYSEIMDDLIQQLAATPSALAHLVAEVDDAALDAAAPGEWSARTILAHFRDDEVLCMRVAASRILAEDDPELHFIDGAEWEPTRNRMRERKEWLLADFALQRQASLGILRMLRPDDWSRSGRGGERQFTLGEFAATWVRHDREHIAQLEQALGETLGEVRARRARLE